MPEEFWQEVFKQGIWAALFVGLLFYVLKTQEKREKESSRNHKDREERLLNALDKAQTNNQQLAIAVEHVHSELEDIKVAIRSR